MLESHVGWVYIMCSCHLDYYIKKKKGIKRDHTMTTCRYMAYLLINCMVRNFFWEIDKRRKMKPIAWKKIWFPKGQEGRWIRSILSIAAATLMHQIWFIASRWIHKTLRGQSHHKTLRSRTIIDQKPIFSIDWNTLAIHKRIRSSCVRRSKNQSESNFLQYNDGKNEGKRVE